MRRLIVLIVMHLVATWPVWRWYVRRTTDGSDEPWGVLSMMSLILLSVLRVRDTGSLPNRYTLIPAAGVLLLYVLSYPFVPPLVHAVLAMTALTLSLSQVCFRCLWHPGLWILALLSLPLMASMQFYLGYPLRVLVAGLTLPFLRLAGYAVTLDGAGLSWMGRQIMVDAPCSGIRMLWVGGFLVGILGCVWNLKAMRICLLGAWAVMVLLIGNVLRAAALFCLEVGTMERPVWLHDAVGLLVFGATALGIVWVARWLETPQIRSL